MTEPWSPFSHWTLVYLLQLTEETAAEKSTEEDDYPRISSDDSIIALAGKITLRMHQSITLSDNQSINQSTSWIISQFVGH